MENSKTKKTKQNPQDSSSLYESVSFSIRSNALKQENSQYLRENMKSLKDRKVKYEGKTGKIVVVSVGLKTKACILSGTRHLLVFSLFH